MITPIRQINTDIRGMSHNDLAQVSDVERRSYDFPWSHGVFRDCLIAGYDCVVLDRDDTIAGYGILSVAAGEAHILNLCVDGKFRKHGYGEQLLDAMLERAAAAEVREIFLEVRPSNDAAISLYCKRGFRRIAARPAYYQAKEGREDAAVFSKVLKKHR